MAFEPTLKELAKRCQDWGVHLDEQKLEDTLKKTKGVKKYTRWDLTRGIICKSIKEFYGEEVPKTAILVNGQESAMMCARFPELTEDQQALLLADNNEFYVEEKMNGHRCLICFSPEEGFKFYANNRDTESLLRSDNTANVLLIKGDTVQKPEDFIGRGNAMFALDSEVICKSKHVDATAYGGMVTDSELNAVGTLMQLAPEISKEIQLTQKDCQLEFHIFDITYFNGNIMNKPLKQRNKIREQLVNRLTSWGLPFYNVPRVYTDKKQYFESLTDSGKEGVVFKNENEIYTPDKTRGKLRQIKWKRTVSGALGDDCDGFIIGFEPSTEGKAFENFIGAIKVGVYLSTVEGEEVLHHIATISGMPMEWRQKFTVIDKETGKPTLNPEYLNLCLTFDGFDIKTKSLRFSHAKVDSWDTCWRPEKTPEMCMMNEEVLRMLSL